jgi:hypothetical protein
MDWSFGQLELPCRGIGDRSGFQIAGLTLFLGRCSEYSSDDVISTSIKAAAMAEHNPLRLP